MDSGLLKPNVPLNDVILGTVRLLSYSFAYQTLWMFSLAVPMALWSHRYTSNHSLTEGSETIANSDIIDTLTCSLAGIGPTCSSNFDVLPFFVPVPVWAFSYVVCDAMYFAGLGKILVHLETASTLNWVHLTLRASAAALSLESATFALLLNVGGSSVLSLYFMLPGGLSSCILHVTSFSVDPELLVVHRCFQEPTRHRE